MVANSSSSTCPFKPFLPIFGKIRHEGHPMGTMNISLPDSLRDFVDQQVATAGYGTSSEFVRELIRREQQRAGLKSLLLEGAKSKPVGVADSTFFDSLRERVKRKGTKSRK
jgi:antitoxin ParD1/3/4